MAGKIITTVDRRVSDNLCGGWGELHYVVDGTTPMDQYFSRLLAELSQSKIERLTIVAHGYAMPVKPGSAITASGFGIQFCKEDIDLGTAATYFPRLKGKFSNTENGIELLGCGAAAEPVTVKTGPGRTDTARSFGPQLCWAIAKAAGTGVYASSDTQLTSVNAAQFKRNDKTFECVDPGVWDGTVWLFKPDGTRVKATPPWAVKK